MNRHSWLLICVALAVPLMASVAQTQPDIRTLFDELNQPKSTDRATQQILQAASHNPDARRYAGRELSKMIDRAGTGPVWSNAVRLAGELKISEAIPSLQRALSRPPVGGLVAYSMTREMRLDDDIVAKALSEIGESAIPIAKKLLLSEDTKTRRRAVLILRNMQIPAAREVLRVYLPRETDSHLKQLIEEGLDR